MDEGCDGVGVRGARVFSWVSRLERRRRIARARMDDVIVMVMCVRIKSDWGDDGDDVLCVCWGCWCVCVVFEFVIDVRVFFFRVFGDVKDARERGILRWIDEFFYGDVDLFVWDEIF